MLKKLLLTGFFYDIRYENKDKTESADKLCLKKYILIIKLQHLYQKMF